MTREDGSTDPGRFSIRQDYEVTVERFLKGSGPTTLKFSLIVGMVEPQLPGGDIIFPEYRESALEPGVRYLLFLRAIENQTTLVPTVEPWRFQLENGTATVKGPAEYTLPRYVPMSEAEIVSLVESAAR
jgi:hypothetical protein